MVAIRSDTSPKDFSKVKSKVSFLLQAVTEDAGEFNKFFLNNIDCSMNSHADKSTNETPANSPSSFAKLDFTTFYQDILRRSAAKNLKEPIPKTDKSIELKEIEISDSSGILEYPPKIFIDEDSRDFLNYQTAEQNTEDISTDRNDNKKMNHMKKPKRKLGVTNLPFAS